MDRVRDLTLLISRVVVGIAFIAHGRLKVRDVDLTVATFDKLDIPFPTLSAWFAIVVECAGGVAFIVGLALPLVGLLFAVVSLGALVSVHMDKGFYAGEGGYEYVLVLAVVSVGLGFNGGRLSLDRALAARRSARHP
ncbi:DoxX family protein [Streptomyces sp. UNOB3_S3]|uniref:DoxX family protein n=1 Tax=Streptomyces sp. UNOB3_S3 TaxID=2871682 RepID=UPI001E39F7D5|nr:DoxX family protein [Streptomyces sp. UNOB3_S3]MCC3775006.1 DoxX family protein [Streptomyces sp. UNOB3_S3]